MPRPPMQVVSAHSTQAIRGEGVSPSHLPRERQDEERLAPRTRGQDALATIEPTRDDASSIARGRPGAPALQDITVRFDAPTGPDRVTITAAPGEFVVVVGPSGCGKSTLLNVAAGMVRPFSGAATIDGREVTGPAPDRAMVFQEHTLFPWLTAAQNVEFGLKMAGVART